MMFNFGAALVSALAAGTANICTIWQVTRTDGVVEYWTDHDQDIIYNGHTWYASDAYSRTTTLSKSDMSVISTEMDTGPRTGLDQVDIDAGTYDDAEIVLYALDWTATPYEPVVITSGRIGNIEIEQNTNIKFEFRGLTQQLQVRIGRIISALCDADLGDTRCGVVLATFTVTGTATGGSTTTLVDSARTEAAGYFANGSVTPTSGKNAGLEREVQEFTGGTFTVYDPWPYPMAVGDTYSAVAGCDKLVATCANRFNNRTRFRGFDLVPGGDAVLGGK